jgi:glycosyltransferase involved in cell wall biosynthesis
MVVSEAFANGLPVITTTNAGAADLVTDRKDGFVIPPADGDALVETMRWCTRHRDELFAMRRTALAAAARRTWAHFRGEFHRALIGAVEGPGAVGRPDAMRAPA